MRREALSCVSQDYTMASFEDPRPKTKAQNSALVGAILFQFQKFQNMEHNPQIFEPWKQKFLEKE